VIERSRIRFPAGALAGSLGQLSLPSLRVGKSSTGLLAGMKAGAFACVGWQVTLCDPIWQVTSRSCEMEFHKQLYAPLPFLYLLHLCNCGQSIDDLEHLFLECNQYDKAHQERGRLTIAKFCYRKGPPSQAWVKCGLAYWQMGKLRTELADPVRILPTSVASCHCLHAQGRTS